jgi:Tfp pilus assembly protein PilF
LRDVDPETATYGCQDHAALGGTPGPIFLPREVAADRFRVVRLLGQGGMAQVFEAEDLELGQEVAIKIIRPDLAASRRARELLRREVLLARRVTHPNVCRIFDVFQHSGTPPPGGAGPGLSTLVLVMELVRGETLSQRLERGGPLTPREALPIARQLAEALDAAHRSQVVHGDFKSSNVILEQSPAGTRAVVTDFGLAQRTSLASVCAGGTTAYMAPEQLRRGAVTPASDIYALGVVLHEMVTGARPPQALDRPANAAASSQPGPRGLPPPWAKALDRCLAPLPADRPASAAAAVRALAAGIAPPPRRRRQLAQSARAALLLLGLGLLSASRGPTKCQPGSLPGAGGGPMPDGEDRGAPPAVRPSNPQAARLYAQGTALLRRGEIVEASAALGRALVADPGFGPAHAALARACADLGYEEQARQEARLAMQSPQRLPQEQRLEIAATWRRTNGDLAGAAGLLRELWRLAPTHSDYAIQLAESQLEGSRPREALETLQLIRARYARVAPATTLDLLEARARSKTSDYRAALAAALAAEAAAAAGGNADSLAAADMEEAIARTAIHDAERAAAALERARLLYKRLGFRAGEGEILKRSAVLADDAGDAVRAQALYNRALAIDVAVGATHAAALVLADLGKIEEERHHLEPASQLLERARSELLRLGDRVGAAWTVNDLALVALDQGNESKAERLFEEALSLDSEAGNREGLASVLTNLAGLEGMRGDLSAARPHLEEALRISEELGLKSGEALGHVNLGCWLAMDGNLHAAGPEFLKAIRLSYEGNWPYVRANAFNGLGEVLTQEGKLALAESALRQGLALENGGADPAATLRMLRDLAWLRLWQARPRDAEDLVRQALRRQDAGGTRPESTLLAMLAAAQAGQGRLAEALGTIARASASTPPADADTGLRVAIGAAHVALVGKRPADAARRLDEALHAFSTSPHPDLIFEARLLRAYASLGAGRDATVCTELRAIQQQAHRQRYELIARYAARLLGSETACNAPPERHD